MSWTGNNTNALTTIQGTDGYWTQQGGESGQNINDLSQWTFVPNSSSNALNEMAYYDPSMGDVNSYMASKGYTWDASAGMGENGAEGGWVSTGAPTDTSAYQQQLADMQASGFYSNISTPYGTYQMPSGYSSVNGYEPGTYGYELAGGNPTFNANAYYADATNWDWNSDTGAAADTSVLKANSIADPAWSSYTPGKRSGWSSFVSSVLDPGGISQEIGEWIDQESKLNFTDNAKTVIGLGSAAAGPVYSGIYAGARTAMDDPNADFGDSFDAGAIGGLSAAAGGAIGGAVAGSGATGALSSSLGGTTASDIAAGAIVGAGTGAATGATTAALKGDANLGDAALSGATTGAISGAAGAAGKAAGSEYGANTGNAVKTGVNYAGNLLTGQDPTKASINAAGSLINPYVKDATGGYVTGSNLASIGNYLTTPTSTAPTSSAPTSSTSSTSTGTTSSTPTTAQASMLASLFGGSTGSTGSAGTTSSNSGSPTTAQASMLSSLFGGSTGTTSAGTSTSQPNSAQASMLSKILGG